MQRMTMMRFPSPSLGPAAALVAVALVTVILAAPACRPAPTSAPRPAPRPEARPAAPRVSTPPRSRARARATPPRRSRLPPPRRVGDRIRLPAPIRFLRPLGTEADAPYRVAPASRPVLRAVARLMRQDPRIRAVEIQSHAAPGPTDALTAFVATRGRARAVMRFLLGCGVAPTRLYARGYGADRPRCQQATAACRRRNERIELHVVATLPRPRADPRAPAPPPLRIRATPPAPAAPPPRLRVTSPLMP